MQAIWTPSPNFAPRTKPISFVIIHGTWMDDDNAAIARLCDPKSEVSCHYFIDKNGKLLQLVEDEHVAWHAGKSSWGNIENLNQHSIGIEISNPGERLGAYKTEQYSTLIKLLSHLKQLHGIKGDKILGHSDIAPDRKTDPGNHFCWTMLESAGVVSPLPFEGWPSLDVLREYGYNGTDKDILEAFKRRMG